MEHTLSEEQRYWWTERYNLGPDKRWEFSEKYIFNSEVSKHFPLHSMNYDCWFCRECKGWVLVSEKYGYLVCTECNKKCAKLKPKQYRYENDLSTY